MTQLSVYCWHGDKSRYTRADPTKTHSEGITVRGPQIGGRQADAGGPPLEDNCPRYSTHYKKVHAACIYVSSVKAIHLCQYSFGFIILVHCIVHWTCCARYSMQSLFRTAYMEGQLQPRKARLYHDVSFDNKTEKKKSTRRGLWGIVCCSNITIRRRWLLLLGAMIECVKCFFLLSISSPSLHLLSSFHAFTLHRLLRMHTV